MPGRAGETPGWLEAEGGRASVDQRPQLRFLRKEWTRLGGQMRTGWSASSPQAPGCRVRPSFLEPA